MSIEFLIISFRLSFIEQLVKKKKQQQLVYTVFKFPNIYERISIVRTTVGSGNEQVSPPISKWL